MKRPKLNKSGFTLVELIVVVAIIAILAFAICGKINQGVGSHNSYHGHQDR